MKRPESLTSTIMTPAGYARTRVLTRAGFLVEEAATGEQALLHSRTATDLVLLDINLPDIDGFEICRRIKSDPETEPSPVIFLPPPTCRSRRCCRP